MPGHDVLYNLTQKPQKYSYYDTLIDGLLITIHKRSPTKDDTGYATGCLWINNLGVPAGYSDGSGGGDQFICSSYFPIDAQHGAYNQTIWWINSGTASDPHWLVPFFLRGT